LRADEAIIRVG